MDGFEGLNVWLDEDKIREDSHLELAQAYTGGSYGDFVNILVGCRVKMTKSSYLGGKYEKT